MVGFGKVWKQMQALHGCIVCILQHYRDTPHAQAYYSIKVQWMQSLFCSGSHEPSMTFGNQHQPSPIIHYQHTNTNLSRRRWGQCKQCKGRVAVLVRCQIPVTQDPDHMLGGVCDMCSWCCLLRKLSENDTFDACAININRWCIQRQHEHLKWYKCIRNVPSFTVFLISKSFSPHALDGLTKVHWQCPA